MAFLILILTSSERITYEPNKMLDVYNIMNIQVKYPIYFFQTDVYLVGYLLYSKLYYSAQTEDNLTCQLRFRSDNFNNRFLS